MSSQLICPLCEECLEEEGIHFLRHFKYKQYPCHEDSCPLEFYTEADRNEHIKKSGHKRSFQKHVNPYISKLVAMVASDARALATSSLDTVLDNRFGVDPDISIITTPKPSPAEPSTSGVVQKKRSLADKTPSAIVKKKSTNSAVQKEKEKETSAKVVEETPRRPSGTTSSTKSSKDTPSSSSRHAASSEVDSTTNDHAAPSSSTSSQKKTKKKRTAAEPAPPLDINEKSYDQMSATEKLAGFFDPNVPARKNAAKVRCADCKEEIVYDYILRKDHVSSRHMGADVAPEDYEDILKAAMDSAFPDLPNTNLACQLCMTAQDIPRTRRREHIENHHTNSLPALECPFLGCGKGYRRQCDLSGHMKDSHKSEMSRYKDAPFQKIRRHRNFMINEVLKKCFPWAELETLEKTEKKVSESSADRPNQRPRTDSEQGLQPLADFSLNNDIRVLERSTNKTRRPPQYNFHGTSSDSSDDDEAQPDYTQEIIFIRECCNSEIAAKLSLRSVQVKQEVVEQPDEQVEQRGSDFLLDEPMDLVDDVKEEVSEEDKKDESSSQPNASNSFAFIGGYHLPPPPPAPVLFPPIESSPVRQPFGAEPRQSHNYYSGRQEMPGSRPDPIRQPNHYIRSSTASSSSHYVRNSNHHNTYHHNRPGPSSSRYQPNSFHSRVVMPPRSPPYRRSSRGRDRSRSRPRHSRWNN